MPKPAGVASETGTDGADSIVVSPTNQNTADNTNSDTSGKTEKRSDKKVAERSVPYSRFNEVNKQATTIRELQSKLGLSDGEFSDFVQNPDSFMSPDALATRAFETRLRSMEQTISQVNTRLQVQAESSEWNRAVSQNPAMAGFKDVLMRLGRQDEYKDMPYEEIYAEAIAPALSEVNAQRDASKDRARVQTKTGVSTVAGEVDDGTKELSLEEFKALSLDDKAAYLKKHKITLDSANGRV